MAALYIPRVLDRGASFSKEDWKRGFEPGIFESHSDSSRARYVSSYLMILSIRFRIWLAQYFPPHPSLNFTSILTFLLSPLLLFALVFKLSKDRITAWCALCFYTVSTGFLSGLTFFYLPAKPITNLFAIGCLYIAALLREGKQIWSLRILLFISISISLFCDEAAFFIPIAIAILFPDLFKSQKGFSFLHLLTLALPIVLYLLFVTFLLNKWLVFLGYPGQFSFWYTAIQTNPNLKKMDFHILENAYYMFRNHLFWSRAFLDSFAGKRMVLCLLMVGGLGYLYYQLPKEKRLWVHRTFIAVIACCLFHILLFTRWVTVTTSCYYYAALVSVFFAILLAFIVGQAVSIKPRLSFLLAILLCFVNLGSFETFNDTWRHDHFDVAAAVWPAMIKPMTSSEPFSKKVIVEAWKKKEINPSELPREAYWLPRELSALHSLKSSF